MRFLQRIFALFTGIMLVCLLPVLEKGYRVQKQVKEWKEIALQRLCEEICDTGKCTETAYLSCQELLQNGKMQYELQILKYQRKEDKYAVVHWYPVAWQEIRERLFTDGSYSFDTGDVLELRAVTAEGEKIFYGGHIK
ncbi:MAG: hypothetical protein ACI4FZ_10535 [Lachnospiraceae bacterium]